jgi:hypothetical protein
MEDEMKNFHPDDYNILRLMMRLKKSVYPWLANLYDKLIEMGNVCNSMLSCDVDENFMETYVSYVTVRSKLG